MQLSRSFTGAHIVSLLQTCRSHLVTACAQIASPAITYAAGQEMDGLVKNPPTDLVRHFNLSTIARRFSLHPLWKENAAVCAAWDRGLAARLNHHFGDVAGLDTDKRLTGAINLIGEIGQIAANHHFPLTSQAASNRLNHIGTILDKDSAGVENRNPGASHAYGIARDVGACGNGPS